MPEGTPGPRTSAVRTRAARAAALSLAAALLAGCQLPDVSMSPGVTGDAAAPSRAAASEAAAPTTAQRAAATTAAAAATPTAPQRPAGDLDSGSLTRTLPAGDRTVVIDYWTADQATTWTAEDDKTIQLAAHVEGGDTGDETPEVLVTRFAVTGDDGTTRALVTEDRGEFALTPPFSYTTALTLPGAPTAATALTLSVQFDLLVETEPGSERYFRQTVLDTLELPLLQEDPS